MDELIERLRARAADPERRADVRVSAFSAGVRGLDLGGLLGQLGSISGALGQVVAANQAGRPLDPSLRARADAIGAAMSTPAQVNLPAPASEATLAAAEARLGFPVPTLLRRAWSEVADGGFGPGVGILSVSGAVAAYEKLREGSVLPRGRAWPLALLPVVDRDAGWDCVDAADPELGRVVAWNPEELSERSSEKVWLRSFEEIAPSTEAWLTEWVGSKTQQEQAADRMRELRIQGLRDHKARIAAMTPEQREAMGLPAVGWESAFIDESDLQ